MIRALESSPTFKPVGLFSRIIFAAPKGLTIVPFNTSAIPLPPLFDALIVAKLPVPAEATPKKLKLPFATKMPSPPLLWTVNVLPWIPDSRR